MAPLNDFNYASADFSDVSGFYGPGSWAAWFLAMVSSLYALYRRPDKVTTLTIISPILYTNWASIDLLRRLWSDDDFTFGPVTAASTVACWGYFHVFSCATAISIQSDLQYAKRHQKLRVMIYLGLIIPCVALGALTYYPRTTSADRKDDSSQVPVRFSDLFKTMYWLHVITASTYMCGVTAIAQRSALVSNTILFLFWIYHMLPVATLISVLSGALWHYPTYMELSCCYKPCAPQSIKEWDQAFSLLCGLVLFLYEAGPDILVISKKVVLYLKKRLDGAVSHFLQRRG
jgi:hypothetical protein